MIKFDITNRLLSPAALYQQSTHQRVPLWAVILFYVSIIAIVFLLIKNSTQGKWIAVVMAAYFVIIGLGVAMGSLNDLATNRKMIRPFQRMFGLITLFLFFFPFFPSRELATWSLTSLDTNKLYLFTRSFVNSSFTFYEAATYLLLSAVILLFILCYGIIYPINRN